MLFENHLVPVEDTPKSILPIVVLAGGQSRRFGREKAFACLNGVPIIELLLERLKRQTNGPIAINCSPESQLFHSNCTIVEDHLGPELGPLAGFHASMCWANDLGYEHVITAPVDTPIIPINFVSSLNNANAPAFSCYEGRNHFLHAVLPVELRHDLSAYIADGGRAAKHWLSSYGARMCEFDKSREAGAFFNVNTPDDLRQLQSL